MRETKKLNSDFRRNWTYPIIGSDESIEKKHGLKYRAIFQGEAFRNLDHLQQAK
jgi:hypothetical protein